MRALLGIGLLGIMFPSLALCQLISFQFPLDDYQALNTQPFGRFNPYYNDQQHVADDVRVSAGTLVKAAANGVVRLARSWKECPNWGHILVIEHALGGGGVVNSIYGHLNPESIFVSEGDLSRREIL